MLFVGFLLIYIAKCTVKHTLRVNLRLGERTVIVVHEGVKNMWSPIYRPEARKRHPWCRRT
jgi:hypothetical protein